MIYNILKISKGQCVKKLYRQFQVSSIMEQSVLSPPCLQGIQILDRDNIFKCVNVPAITIEKKEFYNEIRKTLKQQSLKIPNRNKIKVLDELQILLDPNQVSTWVDIEQSTRQKLETLNVKETNFSTVPITLTFDNWNADELIRAVLPSDVNIARSYSIIGHVIHLNLKDHLLQYKNIIGNILMEKNSRCRTVVNKLNKIDNTYRNFEMELICGENNFITEISENYCKFEFDFSKVYWNPRLSTEHQRIVDLINQGDVLFDVFCGVGPFAIPCAKKRVMVYANDLNPDCHKWLERNIKLNKVKTVETFNKDGVDFIKDDIYSIFLKYATDENFNGKIHITMNLPALALTFIKNFKYLFGNGITEKMFLKIQPTIHVYFFVQTTAGEDMAATTFKSETNLDISEVCGTLNFVRNVSTNKDMIRATFKLPASYALRDTEIGEPCAKKVKGS